MASFHINILLELIAGITYLVWASFRINWRVEQLYIIAKFKGNIKVPFLLHVGVIFGAAVVIA